MTCAEAIAEVLSADGPPLLFGYPGAHTVKLHGAIARRPGLRHVLVRHEQAAAFAADGYARASGGPGVFVTTAGPGATNALTAVAESFTNSVPTVHVCCLVDRPFVGKCLGAWHEADIEAIFRPVVKWSATAREAAEAPRLVQRALREAVTGRPRPTQVCVPRDLLSEPVPAPAVLPPALPPAAPDPEALCGAARALDACERPVILAGGGAVGAAGEVRALADALGAGVATTCMGKGVFPEDAPLSLGMSFGNAGATALAEADLCLAVGCRFTQIATRHWTTPIPADLIHLDLDPAVIDLHYPARFPLVGDAAVGLAALLARRSPRGPHRTAWRARIGELRALDRGPTDADGRLCRVLREALPRETLIVGDVAGLLYRMFSEFDAYDPASFLYPAGYIAMGHGLPAAIGAQLARPDATVVCFSGDGGFLMSAMELATAAQEAVPVKAIVLNNNCLGSIAHFAGDEAPDLGGVVRLRNPDFVALAHACGLPADRVAAEETDRLTALVKWLLAQEGPALLEVKLPPPARNS